MSISFYIRTLIPVLTTEKLVLPVISEAMQSFEATILALSTFMRLR
ncbi:hypothetical protein QPL79_02185 [Ignisphaera sp. 4213-co]|uniref:Uncharacterized protein n=1 Tax=Ignisphaera cupida TaxID=3050454 RepID=A0ABD4Z6C2_9CREN|nr:hypothetical protein [Ignisphaera sp. 4213-co]MDK6028173.1 hypothetical protein [Ignisphaera sp. 4213-co]